jgi:hypothetical protein
VKLVQHVTDDTLELYAMQTLPDSEVGFLEWHLVICQSCRDRLEVEIEFVTAMRSGGEDPASERGQEWS